MDKPLVAVFMVTYNHEKYISQAIKSVLEQKTSFPIKLFIGEDCSNDKTRDICIDYFLSNPRRIKLFLNEINIGGTKNSLQVYQACLLSGAKYIAMLEGDDYWTDPYKLQKQVDFLEAHPDFSMTFGNALIEDHIGKYRRQGLYIKRNEPEVILPEMAIGLGLPTLTMVFRNNIQIPEWYNNVISGDYFLRLILSTKGNFYYHGEVFGIHRKHISGISRTTDKTQWVLNTAENLKCFYSICKESQKKQIKVKIIWYKLYAFFRLLNKKKIIPSIKLFIEIIFSGYFYTRLNLGTFGLLFREVVINKNDNILDIF